MKHIKTDSINAHTIAARVRRINFPSLVSDIESAVNPGNTESWPKVHWDIRALLMNAGIFTREVEAQSASLAYFIFNACRINKPAKFSTTTMKIIVATGVTLQLLDELHGFGYVTDNAWLNEQFARLGQTIVFDEAFVKACGSPVGEFSLSLAKNYGEWSSGTASLPPK